MPMLGAILVPHPPALLPEVGRGRERALSDTESAIRAVAAQAARWEPDVLMVVSSHTGLYEDYFHLSSGGGAAGDLSDFGAPQVRLQTGYDTQLREVIASRAQRAGLKTGVFGSRAGWLDHGVTVPLYFLHKAGVTCPIVRIGVSGCGPAAHYRLGKCAAEAAEALGRRALLVASGNLARRREEDGSTPEREERITAALASGEFVELLMETPPEDRQAAGCGLRAFQIMAGALDGRSVAPRLLSHEAPCGAGYAVALFRVTGREESRRFVRA